MVFITEQLIRSRAEHNECELSTLEEVSLHQLDIERIDYIDHWCRQLKILYLQSNLIGKIENVGKLKKLEYLNLALNNILKIENLHGCESLTKLDLTVNFIGELTSILSLQQNEFLREFYMTGNPCTDYLGYRDYVIAILPQLTHLDGTAINKSERIEALQNLETLKCEIMKQQKNYFVKLKKEREMNNMKEGDAGFNKEWYTDTEHAHLKTTDKNVSKDDDFWNKPTKYTPESRLETHRYMEEQRIEKEKEKSKFANVEPEKRIVRYFNDEGRPFNINQAQLDFKLEETDEYIELDVPCYKHLDTSLIDVDIQPAYVRVTVKDKVLQLVLNEDVSPDSSSAQRSLTTGHLLVKMKKLNFKLEKKVSKINKSSKNESSPQNLGVNKTKVERLGVDKTKVERLEVVSKETLDIYNIVTDKTEKVCDDRCKPKKTDVNEIYKMAAEGFVDNPDVPPLM